MYMNVYAVTKYGKNIKSSSIQFTKPSKKYLKLTSKIIGENKQSTTVKWSYGAKTYYKFTINQMKKLRA